MASELLPVLGGTLLVVLVLTDVFLTVLFPASGHGPLREPLSRGTWRFFATVGRRLPLERRRAWLAYSGPVMITLTIVVWVALLVLGWALIYLPALGTAVVAAQGGTDVGLATAVYVSGFTLTTLGTGDVVPVASGYRILTVTEAAMGFCVFTLVLTYFLSIYPAITRRRAFAASLHHQTHGTGSAAHLLAGLADDGRLSGADTRLLEMGRFLTDTLETHTSYPVLRYFHYRHERYALPRILLLALETVALARSALDTGPYADTRRSSALVELEESALDLLTALVPDDAAPTLDPSTRCAWHARFLASVGVLSAAGLDVVDDLDEGARRYAEQRRRWQQPLHRLSRAGCYAWSRIEVEPA